MELRIMKIYFYWKSDFLTKILYYELYGIRVQGPTLTLCTYVWTLGGTIYIFLDVVHVFSKWLHIIASYQLRTPAIIDKLTSSYSIIQYIDWSPDITINDNAAVFTNSYTEWKNTHLSNTFAILSL